jgi:hypothetical protein
MATGDAPVVVCTYPARNYAGEFATVLREHGISAAVVPSDQHVGEWDVLVPARDAGRATKKVQDLLALD